MPDEHVPNQQQPQTGAQVIRLSDAGEARALFINLDGRFEQFTRGRFKGTIQLAQGRMVRIFSVEANQRLLLRGHDTADLISFYPVTASCTPCIWQGRRLDLGQLAIKGSQAEIDHYSARGGNAISLALRPTDLHDAVRSLLATDGATFSDGWAVHSLPSAAFLELNHRFTLLLKRGLADPSLLGSPEGHRLEQECVRSLVSSLFPTSTARPDASLPARALLISRAEGFMRARLPDPIGAIDLCGELGTSDRTLRLTFRERYGVGPMTYYKYLRLNAVRSRLKADSLLAIAEAAREFGFHHLGNFAADYRRLFGELPSETER